MALQSEQPRLKKLMELQLEQLTGQLTGQQMEQLLELPFKKLQLLVKELEEQGLLLQKLESRL